MTDHTRLHHTHQFIGKKIRRVRWQKLPQQSSIISGTIPEKFATASWDETGPGSKNEIVLWHVTAEDLFADEGKRRGQKDGIDDDCYSLTQLPEIDWKFVRSASLKVDSDVHELQFLNEEQMLYGTGKGDIVVSKWFRSERKIRPVHVMQKVHNGDGCVGFSLFGNDIVSLGSDGSLKRLNLDAMAISEQRAKNSTAAQGRSFGGNFGPLLCIEHFGANEIVTGSAIGHLQIWDLRQDSPSFLQLPSGIQDSGAVTAIRSHPSQRHILVAGYQSGNLAFWDLRNTSLSLTASAQNIHGGPVWELAFHPIYPSHLYSAASDGLLLHWDASSIRMTGENFGIMPWSLNTDQLRDHVKLTSLIPENRMPISSLDVVGDAILAGVDDESVWMIRNLPTY